MAFRVTLLPTAVEDIDETSLFIAARGNPERAAQWRDGALDAIAALADSAKNGLPVPEAQGLVLPYRQTHYHSHRIIFRIDEAAQTVIVARVYHGARRALRNADLD